MRIKIVCKCGKELVAGTESVGKRARCRYCGEVTVIPSMSDPDTRDSIEDLGLMPSSGIAWSADDLDPPLAKSTLISPSAYDTQQRAEPPRDAFRPEKQQLGERHRNRRRESRASWTLLFDTEFSEFITPTLIRLYYKTGLFVVACFFAIPIAVPAYLVERGATVVFGIVTGVLLMVPVVIAAAVTLVAVRLVCEATMVFFRMDQHLKQIATKNS